MIRKKLVLMGTVLCLLGLFVGAGFAQDMPPVPGEIVVSDLGAPRGLAFDDEGTLYIADAGFGGDDQFIITVGDTESTINGGLTGRVVSMSDDGMTSDFIVGLPSTFTSPEERKGVYRAIPNGDSLWLVFAGNGKFSTGAYWMNTIVEIDMATLSTKTIINLDEFEHANDPDGNGFDSNVADIAWGPDGVAYIVDAAGNDMLSWTAEDGLQTVTAWPDNPVPTAVEVAENGDIYVSFLGEGTAPDAAKIEHWSDGELVETFEGLTAVTDILLDGDTLYAVEFINYVEDEAGPGRVVTVDADGVTPVAEGLVAPFAIAMGPDGALYITFGTVEFIPGMPGGVVKVEM